jgi:hypothetical protein
MKNKTIAVWLAFVGGTLGLHRFYLYGFKDIWAWLLPIPTWLGWQGVMRVQNLGQDDKLSWLLLPLLGLSIALACGQAIYYGLQQKETWNRRHNPHLAVEHAAGQSQWLTIFAVALSLLIGMTALMSTLAFSFQRYFEDQIEEARKLSQ